MTARSLTLALAFLVLTGSGCESEGESGPVRTLVGQLDTDADVYVALVADDRDVVVYACDGTGDGLANAALGHPRVWLEIDPDQGFADCGYCDRRFVLIGGVADHG